MPSKRILFARTTPDGGTELWVTDGTTSWQVQDIRPGSIGSAPTDLSLFGSSILFSADDGSHGPEPWISDGTAAGTHLLADLKPGSDGFAPANIATLPGHGWVFSSGDATQLWATDSTATGTTQIATFPFNITPNSVPIGFGNQVIFEATDFTYGTEPWVTDGTTAGTHLLLDIYPGDSSTPTGFSAFGNKVLFWADDGDGPEPWISDGTDVGTFKLRHIFPGVGSVDLTSDLKAVVLSGLAYFQADDGIHGSELWVTDGTPDTGPTSTHTHLVADINPGPFGSGARPLGVVNGHLLFAADGGTGSFKELWITDGTEQSTHMLADINTAGASNPRAMVTADGFALFLADSSSGRDQLWVTDGTTAGTHLLAADSTGWLKADGTPNAVAVAALIGTPGNDALQADSGGSLIRGAAGDDTLTGQSGNDTLDGGNGADHLAGGVGDDLYLVDSRADIVTELPTAGQDTVSASVNYTLPADVETLTLTGTAVIGRGNALGNRISGDDTSNILSGGAGDDTLDGASGHGEADWLAGGSGNDTYLVDSAADIVMEQPGAGSDTILASVSYALPANVEALTLTGTAVAGHGNALDNRLIGNAAANWLFGGAGADTLDGGAGNDVLVGGAGADLFILGTGTGADRITDFTPGLDHLRLAGFANFAQVLAATMDHTGGAVIDLGHGDSVTLAGVSKSALSPADILFG